MRDAQARRPFSATGARQKESLHSYSDWFMMTLSLICRFLLILLRRSLITPPFQNNDIFSLPAES